MLVNFDNLSLVIEDRFNNESFSNLLGPSPFFQITEYDEIDNYPYVGKFNLGTAFRTFFMDFGPYLGVIIFSIIWFLLFLNFMKTDLVFKQKLFKIIIIYIAFCIPITLG